MSVRGRPLEVVPETGVFDLPALEVPAATVHAVPGRVRVGAGTAALPAQVGLVGVMLTGAVLAFSAAQTNALVPQSVRPMPGWLAGVFANAGVPLGHAALIALFTLMFVSYVLAVRGAAELSARVVLVCIAVLTALFLLAPVILSTDVFSYQAYGRMGTLYGTNPYLHGPSTIRLDPLYPFIGSKWVSTPTAYGPLFTALSYAIAFLDISASVVAYKSLAALAFLATIGLVWQAARIRGLDPVRAALLVGLNPLTVVWGLGGGHNDLLMLAPLAAGIYLLFQDRRATGGVMVAAAAAIKLTAGVVLPFALVRPEVERRRLLLGAGIASAVVAVLGFALFGTGQLHLLGTLRQNQTIGSAQSIPGFISTELGLGGVGRLVGVLLGIVFAGVTAWLLVLVHRGRLDWIAGAGWATVTLLITAGSLLPWYIAWLTPLAALSGDRRLGRWALTMTGVMLTINMIGWVPHASTLLGG
ncbi:MAG TPA: glycosyltransferase family 87 protein [Solirubrobacteraceae bacterium]|jgi:alpha-1,6-mannosyltransferase|nr:glycosyltransferase family 87 protein [Solirubrobacteraceae bacterium]